jgi:hypothetical protein
MNKPLQILSDVKVASPCNVDWNTMRGDDRVRHCAQCNLNVFNLSAMSAAEAASLIERAQGRLCVRLFKRADGTVITQDCPVGVRLLAQNIKRAWLKTTSFVALAIGALFLGAPNARADGDPPPLMGKVALPSKPVPANPLPPVMMQGGLALPPRPPPPKKVEAKHKPAAKSAPKAS